MGRGKGLRARGVGRCVTWERVSFVEVRPGEVWREEGE